MLELRPNCECCDRDLPPDSPDARICTFECTFCVECVESRFSGVCPNCSGDLAALHRFPASLRRVHKGHRLYADLRQAPKPPSQTPPPSWA
jgi:hypothetical protein